MFPWGVPGEEHKIIVAPVFKDTSGPTQADIRGERGKYRVQFLLARPGYPITKEREHRFIDEVVGTSHIRIVKAEAERKQNDPASIVLQVLGKNYRIAGLADKDGFLGKLVCELEADSSEAAETEAYGSLAPFLSAWSMNVDIPIHVETIQVTNLTTQVNSLRVVTPHFEMNFGAGTQPFFLDEFCQYASIYREGLNSNKWLLSISLLLQNHREFDCEAGTGSPSKEIGRQRSSERIRDHPHGNGRHFGAS